MVVFLDIQSITLAKFQKYCLYNLKTDNRYSFTNISKEVLKATLQWCKQIQRISPEWIVHREDKITKAKYNEEIVCSPTVALSIYFKSV